MRLDRDELAARFAVAVYGDGNPTGTREDIADCAVKMADALLARLRPAAPPETTPAAYVPKDGDVVTWGACACVYEVSGPAESGYVLVKPRDKRWPCVSPTYVSVWNDSLRPATPAERAAAGLPPAEAPAVDRVALAKEIRSAQVDSDGSGWSQRSPWDRLGDGDIKAYLAAADAAIAYFAARGVKS